MSQLVNDTEIDWTVEFDFDDEAKCESAKEDCERKVEWLAISPCGCETLLCDEHKRRAGEIDTTTHWLLECSKCQYWWYPSEFKPTFRRI